MYVCIHIYIYIYIYIYICIIRIHNHIYIYIYIQRRRLSCKLTLEIWRFCPEARIRSRIFMSRLPASDASLPCHIPERADPDEGIYIYIYIHICICIVLLLLNAKRFPGLPKTFLSDFYVISRPRGGVRPIHKLRPVHLLRVFLLRVLSICIYIYIYIYNRGHSTKRRASRRERLANRSTSFII